MNPTEYGCDLVHIGILARNGATLHHLTVQTQTRNGADQLVLVDATGAVFNPWEVELLHWPPEAEAHLRRSGYLNARLDEQELWCNCAD